MTKLANLGTLILGLSLAACGSSGDGGDDADAGGTATADASSGVADAAPAEPDAAVPTASLVFTTQPSNAGSLAPMGTDVVVEIRDAEGNRITDATDEVTLSFANNAGELLLHAGGNGPTVLEVIDPASLNRLGWFEAQAGSEIRDIQFDPATGLVYYNSLDAEFFALDPITGEQTRIGEETTETRGLEYDSAGTLLALSYGDLALSSYDPETAVVTELGAITSSNEDLNGFNGFAVDPTDGTFYATARPQNEKEGGPKAPRERFLLTVDPVARTATQIALLDEVHAGIAFDASGTLWAVSGNGADTSETLFTVDKATGVSTFVMDVSLPEMDSNDGESLGIIPARLFGDVTVAAVGGVATFSGLQIDASAAGYTLDASATGFDSATSTAFDIAAVAEGAQLAFVDTTTSSQTVAEDVGEVTVSIRIKAAQGHDITATFLVESDDTDEGDASIVDNDFVNIVILAGETTASASFTVIDDLDPEPSEDIVLRLVNTGLAQIGKGSVHTVTITDNEPK